MSRARGLSRALVKRLVEAAKSARRRAYCPYSHHPVGAAVLMGSGRVFTGANIENASFGLSICAERVALFSAVAHGDTSVRAVAVACKVAHPCGACRQVMMEFGDRKTALVMVSTGNDDGRDKITVTRAAAMLPRAFKPIPSGLLPPRPGSRGPRPDSAPKRKTARR